MTNGDLMLKLAVVCSVLAIVMVTQNHVMADTTSAKLVIPADATNKIVGVRMEDVVNNYSNIVPGFANVQSFINKNPQAFFKNGSIQTVHHVFLNKFPEMTPGQIRLNLTAFIKYKEGSRFEKIVVAYNNGAKKLDEVSITAEDSISLKDMSFNLTVGLVDRKLIVSDPAHEVKFVLPIGVGGFDEGVLNEGKVSLLTPRFHHGFIDQRAVISKRERPRYFDGKPFIRILKGNDIENDMTAIGFHTEINDEFVRGFDSHGCMRLRVPDLMALHDLIMDGSVQQTPITVIYRTADLADHPAGKRNKTFKTVVNVGTKESPFFPLDKDNLVQLGYKESGAPVDMLVDQAADNYEDVFSYDTELQLSEQNARRKNECQAKVLANQIKAKDMDKCLDEGKRKDSAKDRIYRKFMGIDSIVSPWKF
jgi:hypothetical protein